MAYMTTGMIDRGDPFCEIEAAMCKVYGSEAAFEGINEAIQVMGGILSYRICEHNGIELIFFIVLQELVLCVTSHSNAICAILEFCPFLKVQMKFFAC